MAYSTRVRYGLRLLVRLVVQQKTSRHLSMSEIAQEEGISVKYLEQIVSLLKPLGILESVRGARGGYGLACSPSDIFMDKVFEALGGLNAPAPCIGDAGCCTRVDVCTTRLFWEKLGDYRREYLRGISLADVAADAPKDGLEFRTDLKLAKHGSCPCP